MDGDVADSDLESVKNKLGRDPKNIILLPGSGMSPEALFFYYIQNMDGAHSFLYRQDIIGEGYSKRSLIDENGPFTSNRYQGYSRVKFKHWFNDNIYFFDKLYDVWEEENKEVVEAFKNNFRTIYNNVAPLNRIPKIR